MKTLWTRIAEIDKYLLEEMTPEESVFFEAKILIDKNLAEDVEVQKQIHGIVRLHHATRLRAELQQIHQNLFSDTRTSFARSVLKYFKS